MFGLDDLRRKAPARAFLLIPAGLLLACCAGQQHPDAQAKADKEEARSATDMTAAMDDAKCQAYGYRPGSPQYFRCRDRFDAERKEMGFTDDVAQKPSK
jgi:hypothetical protein